MRRFAQLAGALSLCIACSGEKDHAPFGVLRGSTGGRGWTPPAGGAGGGATDGGAGTGGTTGAGGKAIVGGGVASAVVPGEITSFDPDRAYLLGFKPVGGCEVGLIAMPEVAKVGTLGFDCEVVTSPRPVIDPATKRLLWLRGDSSDSKRLYAFVSDGAISASGQPIAQRPYDNDVRIETSCPAGHPLARFWVDPDGELIYACGAEGRCTLADCTYFRESGAPFEIPERYELLALGYGDTAMLVSDAGAIAVQKNGVTSVAVDYPGLEPNDARARENGFWFVNRPQNDEYERWHIDVDGIVTREGAYQAPPTGSTVSGARVIDARGSLYAMAQDTADRNIAHIVRLSTDDGIGELVYNEAKEPIVRVSVGSTIVTGP